MDRYELIGSLGSGATAEVYLAKDRHLERKVAIKRMEYSRERLTEVEHLKKHVHPGLPKIYDCYIENGSVSLVMEYFEGLTLKEHLSKSGPFSVERVLQVMIKLSDIIIFLHRQKPSVIYRDLKPENVMLGEGGEVKLIDLGAAFDRNYCDESFDGYGTRGYSAPEIFKGLRVEKTADVFSLGILMYELLTGLGPGVSISKRRPLQEINRAFHIGLERIIEKCTKEEPNMRYRSVEEFKGALARYRQLGGWDIAIDAMKKATVILGYAVSFASVACPLIIKGLSGYGLSELRRTILLLGVAVLLHMILILKPLGQSLARVEKDIFLTEKHRIGLWILTGMLIGAGAILTGIDISPKTAAVPTEGEKLWVDIKDSSSRNILLKAGSVLEISDKLSLEITKDNLPDSEANIYLVADTVDGSSYTSRAFTVKSVDK